MMPPDPLTHAIALARAGQHTEARAILLKILETEPANETAWMWLVLVLPTTTQRIAALDQWLAVNPNSEKARQGLERLRPTNVKPAQPAEIPAPVPPPPLRPVPRDITGSTPPEPIPTRAAPSETRPHSPWILGKSAPEDKPEAPKTGLMDRLRRKENPPQNEDTEIDLGIAAEPDEENLTLAVSRVFTTNIDGTDFNQAHESVNLPGKDENSDDGVLDQLRGKVGKGKPSRPTSTARSIIRAFLFLFYLAVFVILGYFGWKHYGASISAAVLSAWNQQSSNASRAQPDENELIPTASPEPTASPSPEITAVTAPTDTPVPVIGERPAEGLGMVVYSASSSQGNQDIFTLPPEGGEPTNWTSTISGDVGDPTLSTDGRLIYSLNGRDLFQIDAQGQTRKLTSDGAGNREPAWSPDNTRIAFVSDRDGNPEIYIMDADGSEPIRVTDQAGADISPAWSPDSTRLAFASNRDGPLEIYVMNADGSGVIRLTYDLAENNSPNWSPDDRWIVYSGNRSGDPEIYSLSPDGAQQNRLTFSPGADENPVWSPDGYWILFTSDRAQPGLSNLYAMVRDGSRSFAYFETPPAGILTTAWSQK